jgi:hypothetical protein
MRMVIEMGRPSRRAAKGAMARSYSTTMPSTPKLRLSVGGGGCVGVFRRVRWCGLEQRPGTHARPRFSSLRGAQSGPAHVLVKLTELAGTEVCALRRRSMASPV